ncbi:MAG: Dyp-type peroxidase [Chloroflexi bacterium]|nr:Dyp-type peroxidase [Chloroflexota bacterium]
MGVDTPQVGIFALGTASHAWLELDLVAGVDPVAAVARVAAMREPRTTIGGVNLVAGFRPELWAHVAPDAAPAGVHGFEAPIDGPTGIHMPATQHDVVLWLTGAAYDVVFDLSRAAVVALAGVARLAHEMVGWPYHRDLDLTGFIDGTENPTIIEATDAAVIPSGTPGAGGSVLLLQQWEHDAIAWERLPIAEQESIIGRRKADSTEIDPSPPGSHVASTDQDRFGTILRRNIPYGTLSQHGTVFVGFCREQGPLETMLRSMAGLSGTPADRLTDMTHAVTGSYYVIPAADRLARVSATTDGEGARLTT